MRELVLGFRRVSLISNLPLLVIPRPFFSDRLQSDGLPGRICLMDAKVTVCHQDEADVGDCSVCGTLCCHGYTGPWPKLPSRYSAKKEGKSLDAVDWRQATTAAPAAAAAAEAAAEAAASTRRQAAAAATGAALDLVNINDMVRLGVAKHGAGAGKWKLIAFDILGRPPTESDARKIHDLWTRVLDPSIGKGPWKSTEDKQLRAMVEAHGTTKWSELAKGVQGRNGKQCRERWYNQLDPAVSTPAILASLVVLMGLGLTECL